MTGNLCKTRHLAYITQRFCTRHVMRVETCTQYCMTRCAFKSLIFLPDMSPTTNKALCYHYRYCKLCYFCCSCVKNIKAYFSLPRQWPRTYLNTWNRYTPLVGTVYTPVELSYPPLVSSLTLLYSTLLPAGMVKCWSTMTEIASTSPGSES